MLTLSIKKSLFLLGGLLVASAGINAFAFQHTADGIEKGLNQIRIAEHMEKAAQGNRENIILITLAAMDTLVDKDEGAIQPERLAEITESKAAFDANIASLKSQATTPEQVAMISKASSLVNELTTILLGSFKQAIESHADQETLGDFDDKIDALATEARDTLTKFSETTEIALNKTQDDMNTEIHQGQQIIWIANAISLAVMMIGLFLLGRSILFPVNALGKVMQAMAKGDLSVTVPATERKDEIGMMAASTLVFQNGLRETETLRRQQQEREKPAEVERKALMQNLANQFEREVKDIIVSLGSSATEMRSFAEALNNSADHARQRAGNAATASEQASSNVSTVAAATEELSASIGEINQRVADSSRTTQTAVKDAEQTNQTVATLSEAAQKIGEVVNLISEIAGQTNLLALNATIEAARAGEAGKGFAVVASEVKNLASQTAKATEDITAQIAAIQASAQSSVQAIQGIGTIIRQIDSISSAIAAAVEEQGAATQEISRNVQEAAQGTREVVDSIGDVTVAASETGDVAQKVLHAAADLKRQAETLESGVGAFISRIRTA